MPDIMDNPAGLDGFEFVEFSAPEKGVLEASFEKMGFTRVARHRSKDVELARQCGINLIAQCKAAVGDLSRIKRVVKLGGFVNAAPHFTDIPQVINGCSDLMVEVFGDAGRHARSAVACPVLPMGVAVEVDGIFEITG